MAPEGHWRRKGLDPGMLLFSSFFYQAPAAKEAASGTHFSRIQKHHPYEQLLSRVVRCLTGTPAYQLWPGAPLQTSLPSRARVVPSAARPGWQLGKGGLANLFLPWALCLSPEDSSCCLCFCILYALL